MYTANTMFLSLSIMPRSACAMVGFWSQPPPPPPAPPNDTIHYTIQTLWSLTRVRRCQSLQSFLILAGWLGHGTRRGPTLVWMKYYTQLIMWLLWVLLMGGCSSCTSGIHKRTARAQDILYAQTHLHASTHVHTHSLHTLTHRQTHTHTQ